MFKFGKKRKTFSRKYYTCFSTQGVIFFPPSVTSAFHAKKTPSCTKKKSFCLGFPFLNPTLHSTEITNFRRKMKGKKEESKKYYVKG